MELKSCAVFCGASAGARPIYMQAAQALGEELVHRNITLVYGGGSVGLMGQVARTVSAGLALWHCHEAVPHGPAGPGAVVGVIPEALKPRELSGESIGELHTTQNMHQRKALMSDLADCFIALPGGWGTMEELLEIVTWAQLGFIKKPVAVLNVDGYYDGLLSMFDHAVKEGFIKSSLREIVISGSSPADVLDKVSGYKGTKSLIELKQGMPKDVR